MRYIIKLIINFKPTLACAAERKEESVFSLKTGRRIEAEWRAFAPFIILNNNYVKIIHCLFLIFIFQYLFSLNNILYLILYDQHQ